MEIKRKTRRKRCVQEIENAGRMNKEIENLRDEQSLALQTRRADLTITKLTVALRSLLRR